MKKTAGLLLLFGCGLAAADFWHKPYTEWSEKDATKMMNDSPWAKSASVAMSGPGGSSGAPAMAGGGGFGGGAPRGRRAEEVRKTDPALQARGPLHSILWLGGNPLFRSGRRLCV
jgi:hypothetical protein